VSIHLGYVNIMGIIEICLPCFGFIHLVWCIDVILVLWKAKRVFGFRHWILDIFNCSTREV